MWGIIGGSGFEKFDGFKVLEELPRETPFGQTSEGFKKVELNGQQLLFIPRHGVKHDKLPTEVNYRANIFALRKHGATKLLAFSAVGSLQEELKPGDMVIPTQFVDRTKGIRKSSYGGEGLVAHVSLAEATTPVLVNGLKEMTGQFDFAVHFNRTLVIIEGPTFSTKAESHLYRGWKCDIVGMTSYPEYALAREAGLAYLPCCFVTDYDCWKDDIPHVTVEEVIEVMRHNNSKAFKVAEEVIAYAKPEFQKANEIEAGLKHATMSPPETMTETQKQWWGLLTNI